MKKFLYFVLFNIAYSFDIYKLAVQNWCSKDIFMIHGLWPDYINGSYPQNCNGPDYKKLTNMKDELIKYWFDCSLKDSETLWMHEWNRHGKCVYEQTYIQQEEYFNITINIFKKFKPTKNLCFNLNFENIPCLEIDEI
jgi:ribonuclease I